MDTQKARRFLFVGVSILLLLAAARFIFHPEILKSGLSALFRVFSFLLWAIGIAYFLNPVMMWLERCVLKIRKGKRLLSLAIVYALFLGITAFFVAVVAPILVGNINGLIDNGPVYLGQADAWLRNFLNQPWITAMGAPDTVYGWLENISAFVLGHLDDWALAFAQGVVRLGRGLTQFLFGTVLSVYILKDRERMLRGMRRVNCALLNPIWAERLARSAERVNKIFKHFILGQTIDSLILGGVSFGLLLITGVPMAVLQAAILTVTNMIPTLGPIIGAVPCLLITLLMDPAKTFWVLILMIVLQQLDGLLISPRILGAVLKMSPFYIMTGVLIGGGLLGIAGMFLGVPLMASVKAFVDLFVEKRLHERGIELSK